VELFIRERKEKGLSGVSVQIIIRTFGRLVAFLAMLLCIASTF
jgi:hypothetical protein